MNGNSIKVTTKQRLFLGVTIAVLAVAGILLFAFNYSNLGIEKSNEKVQNSVNNEAKIAKLTQDYKQSLKQIIGEYASLDINSSDFQGKTASAKEGLLALSVPSAHKDLHLSAILSLEKISNLLSSNQKDKILLEIDNLRKIANSL